MFKVREEYRREFLGNVSHELKTSLQFRAIFLLYLTELEDKVIRKKYLKRCRKGVERLIYIVEFRYDNQTLGYLIWIILNLISSN
jgi:two-component system phosphate regulon sensor histidine kinase PhoR